MIFGDPETLDVTRNGQPLPLKASLALYPHSPDGFAWGYRGSGPAQLALAILMTFTTEQRALRLHQRFKEDVLAFVPTDEHLLLEDTFVEQWLANQHHP